jgi:hypothetical protein
MVQWRAHKRDIQLNKLSYGPVLAALILSLSETVTLAEAPFLDWARLIPIDSTQTPLERRDGRVAFGEVTHFDVTEPGALETRVPWGPPAPAAVPSDEWVQPPSTGFRTDLDGAEVTIAGFITPLEFEGERITEFLLVPYFGACIHVPPPPANQIILVTEAHGVMPDNLFDPVTVTGVLRVSVTEADFGEIGYRIEGGSYEPMTAP